MRKSSESVLGQDARVFYKDGAANGSLRAMLVVQFELSDKVKMVPHQAVEYRFYSGSFVEVANGPITRRTRDNKVVHKHRGILSDPAVFSEANYKDSRVT